MLTSYQRYRFKNVRVVDVGSPQKESPGSVSHPSLQVTCQAVFLCLIIFNRASDGLERLFVAVTM